VKIYKSPFIEILPWQSSRTSSTDSDVIWIGRLICVYVFLFFSPFSFLRSCSVVVVTMLLDDSSSFSNRLWKNNKKRL